MGSVALPPCSYAAIELARRAATTMSVVAIGYPSSGKVEEVVKEAEEVAEVVEKVASTTEKLSAEVAEKLQKGQMKEIALEVEHVSSVAAKDAQMTQDFIHKVGDLKQDLKNLETMVEPVIDKIEHRK
ncbi:hypothetical protein Ccrd_004547 [Cynara cardunculus var. scolymus]|uniref:Uncharacterized protein n=1 Tax=Cynara cardunculus var. scolymus TaxID=59895 RepID=A0A124SCD2_CYNCS|nr:hypothetical protein Ccrd_004547 [Cynara cardunculus var. scolymus]